MLGAGALTDTLLEIAMILDSGARPTTFESPVLGESGILYLHDTETPEENHPYALVGFQLPEGIFAEIEDGTYGELQAFRIYL